MLALSQEIPPLLIVLFAPLNRRKNIIEAAKCQGASKPATNLLQGIVSSSLNTNAAGTSDKLSKPLRPSKRMIV